LPPTSTPPEASPEVPLPEPGNLATDGPFAALKSLMDDLRAVSVARIYSILPALNDSKDLIYDPKLEAERVPDKGDYVIRNVFREYLIWRGDTEILSRAVKTASINEFLQNSMAEHEDYIKFFEAFESLRDDTSHFLRDAICDYILPPEASCMTILGGRVAIEDDQRKMGVEGWDILYQYFSHAETWVSLEQYSTGYDDLLLAKKLSALHRYGFAGCGTDTYWLHPDDGLSQECQSALF
jgi:hypothetical protein